MPTEVAPDFDLQCHSLRSDGELTPTEVVRSAAAAGVRTLALTDHDTVAGVREAVGAGERAGVRVSPAVEMSTMHAGAGEDLHVLGYGVEVEDPALQELLALARSDRHARAERIAVALRAAGLELDETALRERRAEGLAIGRPHLAAAVIGAEANRRRLAREGPDDASAVLEAYLIPGRPAYVARALPSVEEAIRRIHGAGGVAVWAHPFWDVADPAQVRRLLSEFAAIGLDGVEAFYVSHDADQTRVACEAATALGLLRTGSSDFHGPSHRLFSRWRAFDLHGCEPELGPIGAPERR